MSGDEEKTKIAAACASCGSVYAARVWSDGTIHLIGSATECECGCGEFVRAQGGSSGT